jgi:general secretion pathway protein K
MNANLRRPPKIPTPTPRGAALLTAMVIVTVVASLSAAMVWQQWRAVQVESAERARAQSYWLLSGSRDWARLILSEDAKGSKIDHLGEPWAVPLAEARLSTFLAADKQNTVADDDEGVEAFLSGRIIDLQSRYNLKNLFDSTGHPIEQEERTLQRLCELAKTPNGTAQALIDGFQSAQTVDPAAAQQKPPSGLPGIFPNDYRAPATTPKPTLIMPQTFDDLRWFGLTEQTLEALRPWVTLLPVPTAVNINTAPREVMVAVIEGLDQGLAQRIIQSRQQKPFEKIDDVIAVAPDLSQFLSQSTRIDTKTAFFEITGRLRLDNQVIEERTLVRRNARLVKTWHTERINTVLGDTDG